MKLKGVIFDWAGTTVDFGSRCPVACFQRAFQEVGLTVHAEDVHQFMGRRKRDHVQLVLELPHNMAQWRAQHDAPPTPAEIDALYHATEEAMDALVGEFALPVPHLPVALDAIRAMGLKVGSTSGYPKRTMEVLAREAATYGYTPDAWMASDEVPEGRPAPWMVYRNMERLGIYPTAAIVKVGDTVADMREGVNTQTWNIGVVESSSLLGKSYLEFQAMSDEARQAASAQVSAVLLAEGAHGLIRNLSELPGLLVEINERLQAGERPSPLERRRPL